MKITWKDGPQTWGAVVIVAAIEGLSGFIGTMIALHFYFGR